MKPVDAALVARVSQRYGTPVYVYDADAEMWVSGDKYTATRDW